MTHFSGPFQRDDESFVSFEIRIDPSEDALSEATRQFAVQVRRISGDLDDDKEAGTLRGELIDIRHNPFECRPEGFGHERQASVVGYAARHPGSSHLLVIRTVEVVPDERGRLMGLFMAAAAIEQFSSARRIDVIVKPYPDYDGNDPDQEVIDDDVDDLCRYFSLLGLRALPGSEGWMIMHAEDFDPESFFARARPILAGI